LKKGEDVSKIKNLDKILLRPPQTEDLIKLKNYNVQVDREVIRVYDVEKKLEDGW